MNNKIEALYKVTGRSKTSPTTEKADLTQREAILFAEELRIQGYENVTIAEDLPNNLKNQAF